MKTSELIGPALDWAVAKCEGEEVSVVIVDGKAEIWRNEDIYDNYTGQLCYTNTGGSPRFLRNGKPVGVWGNPMSSYLDWPQAGPIIERECIATYASGACSVSPKNPDYWVAEILDTSEILTQYGPTPLIAAMRCYVASKLGDEVEIPSELQP